VVFCVTPGHALPIRIIWPFVRSRWERRDDANISTTRKLVWHCGVHPLRVSRKLRAERSSDVSNSRRPHCGERGTKRSADEMGCEARCFVPRIDEVAGSHYCRVSLRVLAQTF
jgi:hypothetical protein